MPWQLPPDQEGWALGDGAELSLAVAQNVDEGFQPPPAPLDHVDEVSAPRLAMQQCHWAGPPPAAATNSPPGAAGLLRISPRGASSGRAGAAPPRPCLAAHPAATHRRRRARPHRRVRRRPDQWVPVSWAAACADCARDVRLQTCPAGTAARETLRLGLWGHCGGRILTTGEHIAPRARPNCPRRHAPTTCLSPPRLSAGLPAADGGMAAPGGKRRLRWTPELHKLFLSAVNALGGAERATPKQIMLHMSVEGARGRAAAAAERGGLSTRHRAGSRPQPPSPAPHWTAPASYPQPPPTQTYAHHHHYPPHHPRTQPLPS